MAMYVVRIPQVWWSERCVEADSSDEALRKAKYGDEIGMDYSHDLPREEWEVDGVERPAPPTVDPNSMEIGMCDYCVAPAALQVSQIEFPGAIARACNLHREKIAP